MNKFCEHCNGKGWYEEYKIINCWQCEGIGVNIQYESYTNICLKCRGSGKLKFYHRVQCEYCNK